MKLVLSIIFFKILIPINTFSQEVSFYDLGMISYKKNDYKTALIFFSKSVNSNDLEKCSSLIMYGAVKIEQNELAEAFDTLSNAINCNPKNSKSYFYLGRVLGLYGDFDSAIKQFDKAILLNSNDSEYYIQRGLCKKERKQFLDAKIDIIKALEIDSTDSEVHAILASIAAELGDLNYSIQCFRKSVLLSPNGTNLSNLGAVQELSGFFEDAIQSYTESLKYQDCYFDLVYVARGKLFLKMARKNDACIDFEKSSKLGNPEALKLKNKYCI